MPGAGKTTLASVLSRQLKWKASDLDACILSLNPTYNSIKAIFKSEGALAFRQMERKALEEVVQRGDYLIIATGGGTPYYFNNMDFMLDKGLTIFLNANTKSIYKRIRHDSDRPLFEGFSGEGLLRKLQDMHIERQSVYQRAHITFNTNYLDYLYQTYGLGSVCDHLPA